VGPRNLVFKAPKLSGKRQAEEKPTTSRALVLRNGKYGTGGTGEVILMRKMSGFGKMDLLAGNSSSAYVPCELSQYYFAEDLASVEQFKKALMNLEQCLKIDESQCDYAE
jgi:hypothetical protein